MQKWKKQSSEEDVTNWSIVASWSTRVQVQHCIGCITMSSENDVATMVVSDEQQAPEEETPFDILYYSMVYLLALLVAGDIFCGKFLRVIPPLVGHIIMGVLLGPQALKFVPNAMTTAFPILGELGLVLMLCKAGLEMDLPVLQAVGLRGTFMALIGSMLPTSIGFLLSYFVLNLSVESSLAVGCSFGPTSAGIALNVLEPCGVLRTPVGQLIVAIAIVDDIIALVVLSQLRALTAEEISVSAIAIPIVSSLLWLFMGGAVALYGMPVVWNQVTAMEQKLLGDFFQQQEGKTPEPNTMHTTKEEEDESACDVLVSSSEAPFPSHNNHALQLAHIVILLFALLPATYYSESSHLLGAFLAGLCMCHQPQAANSFKQELDKIISWLLRIFFGATIAFVIPVQLFGNGQAIANGFLLSLSLLGKIMTGILFTPVHLERQQAEEEMMSNNDTRSHEQQSSRQKKRHWLDRQHIRDCLVVGFSMAGEAEFAMLVAGFGYTEGLLEEDIYASTVFAILLSTILSPCLLRSTLAFLVVDQGDNEQDNISDDAKEIDANGHIAPPVLANGYLTATSNLESDTNIEVVETEKHCGY
jgi:Kef-type K+ transport system membrane component KefB